MQRQRAYSSFFDYWKIPHFFSVFNRMGLGKTLQAISFLNYLKIHQLSDGPFFILCPLSVTDGWMHEFSKFCPSLKVLRYTGDKLSRRAMRATFLKHFSASEDVRDFPFDVLLTTYDIAIMDQHFLSQVPWKFCVIDEAQRLKNPSSVLYNILENEYIIPRRLLMTGTPIQNNLSELWALLHFCMPSIFGTLEQFASTFKDVGTSSKNLNESDGKQQVKVLKYILRAFMLRRTKSMLIDTGVLTLPPLTEVTVMTPLVPLQKKVYTSILRRELPNLLAFASGASYHQSLQNIVVQLRKACSHPYLFNGIEPEPFEEGEHLVQASGKLIVLDMLLQKLHASGHRVLLFAQMTHTLDVIQDFLELRRYTYERLDGSVRAEERFAAIRSFSVQKSKVTEEQDIEHDAAFVFLISTRAGGTGLNLVAADTVIFYEQDWNPQVDKQALQRAHRIGQINHILAINLVTERSIEEVIMRRAGRKLQLCHEVFGEENNTQQPAPDLESLIFGLHIFGLTDLDGETSFSTSMEQLNAMTEKIIRLRSHKIYEKDYQKFEINTETLQNAESITFDPGLDEKSYLSWVEKFKEASKSTQDSLTLSKNKKEARVEAKKEAREKKLAKWEASGYRSLSVSEPPVSTVGPDTMSDSGSVQFVYGDCTKPSLICPSEPTIIFSTLDDSGRWGHGGVFDALGALSDTIPEAYQRAFEFGDLKPSDLHLIKINDSSPQPRYVALAVAQSYNPRRKLPRSGISIAALDCCLSKACFSAAQISASIHMPRISDQVGPQRADWYAVDRLLRKYAAIHSIKIFVYYYRR
ncbi:SNF2 domain-containing protein / helicase domain-containing protein isoform X1 [Wolffia australiana]